MIVFVDRYSEEIRYLQKTLQSINLECEFVVFEDSFFLPDGMLTMSEYLIRDQEQKPYLRKELHYAFLDIPNEWQIQPYGSNGVIYNLEEKVASIYFREPVEERIVERVEWISKAGLIQKIDYYNRYGFIACRIFMDSLGQPMQKVYYTSGGEEILCCDIKTHMILFGENGGKKHVFASQTELECMIYTKQIACKERLLLTSKRQAELLSVVEEMTSKNVEDAQITDAKVILGDITEIQSYTSRFPLIILSNANTVNTVSEKVAETPRICYYGVMDKEHASKGDILILTSSDRIEGIEILIEGLQDKVFHIAANTAVSDKLLSLNRYPNVRIYQQVRKDKLQELLEKCSFYLDINYGREIHNALIQASMNHLLILGFENTLHNSDYVLRECVWKQGDSAGLVENLKLLIKNDIEYRELLEKQNALARKTLDILASHFT